jgi:hypothetical protein
LAHSGADSYTTWAITLHSSTSRKSNAGSIGEKGGFVHQNDYLLAAGGPVGSDTIPAWLSSGEFIFSKARSIESGSLTWKCSTVQRAALRRAGPVGQVFSTDRQQTHGAASQVIQMNPTINLHGSSSTADKEDAKKIAENQPITVRGAMYRGIGVLWKDSANPNYRQCGSLILKMRRLGLIPYSWITDGTRSSDKPSSWSGLADFAETVAQAYRKDLWERQPDYIEVFTEKDAMSGVIRPVTREYDVRLNPIRGDVSETFVWSIAETWKEIQKPIHAYYLGDAVLINANGNS